MRRALLLIWLAAASSVQGQDQPNEGGPTTLIITYRCAPAQRTVLRRHMNERGLARFEQWKTSGLLASYHILFSRYVDSNNWDMMAVLDFSSYSGVAKWKEIEKTTAAGLTADALAWVTHVNSYPVDRIRRNTADRAAAHPVYFVIPYLYSVSTPEYVKYFDGYVKPQFEGWIGEGVLASYSLYLQRYTAGRPWDSLIVLEYKDDESFGAREKIVAKVRARLQNNPAWKAISDNKHNVRTEKETVIADELSIERRERD